MTEMNGKNLTAPAERTAGRKYCETCRFSQLLMSGGGMSMICRDAGPKAIGGVVIANQGGQRVVQFVSQTVWPAVTREDWCPRHQDDAAARPTLQPANESVIARS